MCRIEQRRLRLDAGSRVIANAMNVVSSNDRIGDVNEVVNNVEATPHEQKRQRKMPVAVDDDGGLAENRSCMREVELAMVDLESCKLAFEQR